MCAKTFGALLSELKQRLTWEADLHNPYLQPGHCMYCRNSSFKSLTYADKVNLSFSRLLFGQVVASFLN